LRKVSRKNSEHYNWGNNCDGWHLLKDDDLSIIQEKVPPGASEIKHYHKISRQFFYVLKGTATIEIEGHVSKLNPYEGIEVKPGQTHQLRNETQEDIEFIVVSSPKSHDDRVVV
jgi:mannose-6-phosphate isomerase-like protein (cupin superfamily)